MSSKHNVPPATVTTMPIGLAPVDGLLMAAGLNNWNRVLGPNML